jgi:hypothetical protein
MRHLIQIEHVPPGLGTPTGNAEPRYRVARAGAEIGTWRNPNARLQGGCSTVALPAAMTCSRSTEAMRWRRPGASDGRHSSPLSPRRRQPMMIRALLAKRLRAAGCISPKPSALPTAACGASKSICGVSTMFRSLRFERLLGLFAWTRGY